MLETVFDASKEATASGHLPSSSELSGALNEKVCNCLFFLNSRVSWGFVFVCWIRISVCFLIRKKNHYPCKVFESLWWIVFRALFLILWNTFTLFVKKWIIFYHLWFTVPFLSFSIFGIYFTLLSKVFFRNVIHFEKNVKVILSCHSINLKH